MPARIHICPYCEYASPTFLTDEEIDSRDIVCPKCACPMKSRDVRRGDPGTSR